jgi:restriction endonuclease S subunit
MHSDVLMHRAVDVSEGSLSPTIKWKILAEEKFKLPPLPEQKRLADLLWSVDKYVENKLCMNEKMILLLKSLIKKIFNLAKEKISLEEVLKEDCFNIEKTGKGKVPYIEIGDIDISEKRVILKNKPAVSGSKYAKQKDILISRVRPTRGAITIINFEKIAVSNAFTIIRSNEKVKQELLFFLLAYNDHLLSYLGRRSTGSTYPTINDSDIFSYKIPLMNEKNQKKLLSKCLALKQCSDLCNMDIKKIKEINQQLINQIFR